MEKCVGYADAYGYKGVEQKMNEKDLKQRLRLLLDELNCFSGLNHVKWELQEILKELDKDGVI